jgi:hypothetical protein
MAEKSHRHRRTCAEHDARDESCTDEPERVRLQEALELRLLLVGERRGPLVLSRSLRKHIGRLLHGLG